MMTHDFVAPFYSTGSAQGDEKHDMPMDLTMVIVKLYFETKGKIEKKLGDLDSLAVAYWPFYLVPINANNAYVLEARSLYTEKIYTRVAKDKIPVLAQYMDEASVAAFLKGMEKYVGKVEGYPGYEREERKFDGLIGTTAFTSYFVHLFKNAKKPYLDSSFVIDPALTGTAVHHLHEEVLKIFDDEPVAFLKRQGDELEKACARWITKIEGLIANQPTDPVASLKKKGEWRYPMLADALESMVATLKDQIGDLRAKAKQELLKESILTCDQAIDNSSNATKALEEYKRKVKEVEEQVRHEKDIIEAQRQAWEEAIVHLREITERMRRATKEFEDQEKTYRNKFLEERTIAFKTSKIVTCGLPVFLLNFVKKGKVETVVRAPVVLEEISLFHKNPFQEPKGFNEFENHMNNWFLKSQNEFEVQKNIKAQDLFSMPNLRIEVSNNIDRLLDLGYLDKKKHKEIRDEEIHQLFSKG